LGGHQQNRHLDPNQNLRHQNKGVHGNASLDAKEENPDQVSKNRHKEISSNRSPFKGTARPVEIAVKIALKMADAYKREAGTASPNEIILPPSF
jgi:hypothetical protein